MRHSFVFAIAIALVLGVATPQASAVKFHSEAAHSTLEGFGTSTQILKTGAGEELRCTGIALTGTMSAKASEEIDLVPDYSGCKFKSGGEEFTAHLDEENCTLGLSVESAVIEEELFEGAGELKCEAETSLEVEITVLGSGYPCLSVPAQAPSGKIEYELQGVGPERVLETSADLSGVEFTRESLCGEGTFESGSYSGDALIEAEAESQVGLWVGPAEFHSEAGHTELDGAGTSTQILKTGAEEEVRCTGMALAGTMASEASEEIDLAPDYGGCKFKSGEEEFTAHVDEGSCGFGLGISVVTGENPRFHGPVEVECGESEDAILVEITVLSLKYQCLKVPAQEPEGSVSYTPSGSGAGRALALELAMSGIEYSREGACVAGEVESASYSGEATVAGASEAEAAGIWIGKDLGDPTFVTGQGVEGEQLFETTIGDFGCSNLSGAGVVGKEATEIDLPVNYSGCEVTLEGAEFAFVVEVNSCYLRLQAEVTEGHAPLEIECFEVEDKLEWNVVLFEEEFPCLEFPPQTPNGGVTYAHQGSSPEKDTKILVTLSNVTYTEVAESPCHEGGMIVAEDGVMTGSITLSGFSDEAHTEATDFWWE